jgi:hypothetical protein
MEHNIGETEIQPKEQNRLHQITPVSKYLAIVLLIVLPFVGGWIGYQYAPEKLVEVEKIVTIERTTEAAVENNTAIPSTTVDMVAYRIQYTEDAVRLLNGPDAVQTIQWNTDYRSFYTDEESLLITNWDINFDGYLDVGLLTSVGYGGVNRFYDFYTFNSSTYRLEKMEEFEVGMIPGSLVNPSLDVEKQIITTGGKSGPDWVRADFFFRDGTYLSEAEMVARFGVEKDIGNYCEADSDCSLVQPDCEDCTFSTISKSDLNIFQTQKSNQCELNPPSMQCDIIFSGEVQCIDSKCQITE